MTSKPPRGRDDSVSLRPQRVPLRVPVRCHVIGAGWCEGVTENISRTGALVRTAHGIPLGAEIDIVLTVPHGILIELAGEIICSGSVVRLVPPGEGKTAGIGIMFRKCRPTVAGRSV